LCGASYAFSEQQLIDCTYHKYNYDFNFGCQGGDPATTIQHALQGLNTEAEYPYVSGQTNTHGGCRSTVGSVRLSGLQIRTVLAHNENALADALATYGPIAVTLNGENNGFYNYRGGIYNDAACSTQANHAVLLIGYGTENGQPYWIIKNSWGTAWGEGGFMKLARGLNRCGIVSQASYFIKA
jgi:C1A family cysteine protease